MLLKQTFLCAFILKEVRIPNGIYEVNKLNKKQMKSKDEFKGMRVKLPKAAVEEAKRLTKARRGNLEDEELKEKYAPDEINADNDYLGPFGGNGLTIGLVDEVAGEGATEVPEFVPTRHELLQLVKYWERRYLELEHFFFWSGQSGSTDIRVKPYANRRIARIAKLIGDEDVSRAIDEVWSEFAEQNPRDWDVFLNGDEKQWKEVQEKTHREMAQQSEEYKN